LPEGCAGIGIYPKDRQVRQLALRIEHVQLARPSARLSAFGHSVANVKLVSIEARHECRAPCPSGFACRLQKYVAARTIGRAIQTARRTIIACFTVIGLYDPIAAVGGTRAVRIATAVLAIVQR
jgi:hypothetical protein